jgi:hypothetical protein
MTFFDFIMFFVYVIIFHILFSLRRKKYPPVLRVHHRNTFWLKVISSFAYCIFVLYISPGDTTALYFPEGYNIYQLILRDPSNVRLLLIPAKEFDQALLADILNLGYFNEESNFMVTKITAVLCFITFGKFMAINLIFSMLSFTGVWKLYLFFYEQYPQLRKQFAIAVLYLPTFIFWSSGILKDPLCTGALGWLTYSLYHCIYSRKGLIKNIIIVIVSAYLLSVLKVYILVSYLPAFGLFLALKNVTFIRNKAVKATLVLSFVLISIFVFLEVAIPMQQALGGFATQGLTKSITSYQINYARQEATSGSNFSLGVEFDGSLSSLGRIAPAAIVATLFRPFIWESKKISTLLSSLESLALMLFTLFVFWKVGIKKFFLTILQEPIVLYCFLFSLVFALFVGATTLNFGTLVRYKIPAMPFYVASLFLILYFNNKIKIGPPKERA